MSHRVVTFGEIMLRLKSPAHERLLQSPWLEATFGGGEANVAASLAAFGVEVDFVTALPANALGEACLTALRSLGIGTSHIVRAGERLGLYFLEAGSNQRPSRVLYDRSGSAFMLTPPQAYDWPRLLDGASWFHVSGITPALSENTAAAALAAMRTARQLGLTVSCDYNFRKNLWKYGRSAQQVMPELVRLCDVGMANEEDCQKALGISAQGIEASGDPDDSALNLAAFQALSDKVLAAFPGLRQQAITLRESVNADRNAWSACLNNRQTFLHSVRYDLSDVVDRVGTGDAFAAGLIYGSLTGLEDRGTLEFAAAASCLKHTIPGDMNRSTVAEVEQLLREGGSGRISR
ncbi:MAG TPA: sugar kinase [Anaerolineales bacterium]|nr:sugar kinase [Anaerolineales bacterium]